jgi:lycopene beta-cyclase
MSIPHNGVYNIGTRGGRTKASTGYTFSFIQKHSENIVQALITQKKLIDINDASKRFKFYDRVLLQALINGKPGGKEIFSRLFEQNKADSIFKFLDNESSIAEELAIIKTLQTVPFLKAALQQML